MTPLVFNIISGLLNHGLTRVAEVAIEKGVDYVEEKIGVPIKEEKDMTEEEYKLIERKAQEFEEFRVTTAATIALAEMDSVNLRHKTDMLSESFLSKNIRPLSLIYILTAYLLLVGLSSAGVSIPEIYVNLLGQWGMLVFTFYFGARSVEKIMSVLKNKKGESNE